MVGLTLVAEAKAVGLNVLAGDDGRLIVRGPRSADALARKLLAHKADVLAALSTIETPAVLPTPVPAEARVVCRCGSTAFINVLIHGGQSQRRECAKCGRFHSFPVWHGVPAD